MPTALQIKTLIKKSTAIFEQAMNSILFSLRFSILKNFLRSFLLVILLRWNFHQKRGLTKNKVRHLRCNLLHKRNSMNGFDGPKSQWESIIELKCQISIFSIQ